MTPDEHAAEAERLLTEGYAPAALVHATLAARPAPLVEYTTELTDGPTHVVPQPGLPITIWGMTRAAFVDYASRELAADYTLSVDAAIERIADRLYATTIGLPAPTTET